MKNQRASANLNVRKANNKRNLEPLMTTSGARVSNDFLKPPDMNGGSQQDSLIVRKLKKKKKPKKTKTDEVPFPDDPFAVDPFDIAMV